MNSYHTFRDDLQKRFTEIEQALDRLIDLQSEIRREEQERDRITKQSAMIREVQALGSAMGSHKLNTITDRYSTCKRDEGALNVVKENVRKYQSDSCALLMTYFDKLLAASTTNELVTLQLQLCELQNNIPANEFQMLQALLEQCGQEPLFEQCDFTRKEMDNTLFQQCRCALESIDLLQQYIGVMQFYPRSHLLKNNLIKYEKAYRELLSGAASVSELQQQFEAENAQAVSESVKLQAVQYAVSLEEVWIETNMLLTTSINEMNDHNNQVVSRKISFPFLLYTIIWKRGFFQLRLVYSEKIKSLVVSFYLICLIKQAPLLVSAHYSYSLLHLVVKIFHA